MTSGRAFARNSAVNLVGLLLPLIVAFLAIPPLMHGLGADRFGILTLAWAAVGYFGLFELGLSRALTQAVAQRLGSSRTGELPSVVWTALLLLLVCGIVGVFVLVAVTPALINHILKVPAPLREETTTAFYVLATGLPFVVTSVGLRGLLEAHQHFGAAAALRVPLVAFTFVGPLLALPFSRSLVPAVSLLVIGRIVTWAAHVVFCLRRYPYLRARLRVEREPLRALLRFGGWTTVTNVVSPMMTFLDRFLIGALLSMAAVAHYVTPFEIVSRMLVIPAAVVSAVFPAFAALFATDRTELSRVYGRAIRAVVLTMFPVVLVTMAFAGEGLQAWIGPTLPRESTVVLQWLAVGVFVNAIAQAPYAILQGANRPQTIAKLHLVELPLYAVAIWILVRHYGLPGVAMAWTLRVGVDAIALLIAARRTVHVWPFTRTERWPLIMAPGAFLIVAAMDGIVARMWFVAATLAVFALLGWRQLLTNSERDSVRRWLRKRESLPASEPEGVT